MDKAILNITQALMENGERFIDAMAGKTDKPLPLNVECPRCMAIPGWSCVSRSITGTFAAKTHAARWKAIGIDRPSDEDRSRDYWDFKKREQDRILAAHPARRR